MVHCTSLSWETLKSWGFLALLSSARHGRKRATEEAMRLHNAFPTYNESLFPLLRLSSFQSPSLHERAEP
jgi:hypothetical protein